MKLNNGTIIMPLDIEDFSAQLRQKVLEPVSFATYAWSEGKAYDRPLKMLHLLIIFHLHNTKVSFFLFAFLVQQGEVQYFIGVQLDGSQHVEPLHNCIAEDTAKEGEQLVWSLFKSFISLAYIEISNHLLFVFKA